MAEKRSEYRQRKRATQSTKYKTWVLLVKSVNILWYHRAPQSAYSPMFTTINNKNDKIKHNKK